MLNNLDIIIIDVNKVKSLPPNLQERLEDTIMKLNYWIPEAIKRINNTDELKQVINEWKVIIK